MPDTTACRIAAIVSDAPEADAQLHAFVRHLQAQGTRVRGLLQTTCPASKGCQLALLDVETGQQHPISQDLGPAAQSCTLDPAALVEAGQVLRRIRATDTDLVVFNRFSGLEAEGGGFAAEMLDLMSRGLPVLTLVRPRHLPAWERFTGGLAQTLPCSLRALENWLHGT